MAGRTSDASIADSQVVRELFARMDARDISQADMATQMGVHATELSLWRHGRRMPTVANIQKMAAALNLQIVLRPAP